MKKYLVTVSHSDFVEANNSDEACELMINAFLNGSVKVSEIEADAEEWD